MTAVEHETHIHHKVMMRAGLQLIESSRRGIEQCADSALTVQVHLLHDLASEAGFDMLRLMDTLHEVRTLMWTDCTAFADTFEALTYACRSSPRYAAPKPCCSRRTGSTPHASAASVSTVRSA